MIEENVEIGNYFETDEHKSTPSHNEALKSALKQLRTHIRRLNVATKNSDPTVVRDVPNLKYKFKLDREPTLFPVPEDDSTTDY